MNVKASDEHFFQLAIKTVLYSNKERLHRMEDELDDSFLNEISKEILLKAQSFKRITEVTMRELEQPMGTRLREGAL